MIFANHDHLYYRQPHKRSVGQAVRNINLMFGIDETNGLRLKASAL